MPVRSAGCRCPCRAPRSGAQRRRPSARRRSTRSDDLAALGELDRVAEEVDRDLAQAVRRRRRRSAARRRDEAGELEPLLAAPRRRAARSASSTSPGARSRRSSSSSLPGLDLREVEDVVQDMSSDSPRDADRVRVVALLGVSSRVEQQPGHADDAVHRRADLVAHVARNSLFALVRRVCRRAGQRPPELRDVVVDRVVAHVLAINHPGAPSRSRRRAATPSLRIAAGERGEPGHARPPRFARSSPWARSSSERRIRSAMSRPIASSSAEPEQLGRRRVPARGTRSSRSIRGDRDRADLDERLEVLLLASISAVRSSTRCSSVSTFSEAARSCR